MLKTSIRKKLIIFLFIATVAPMLLSMLITYTFTENSVTDQSIRQNTNLLFQGSNNLINYMNTINQSSLSVYTDGDFLRILEAGSDDFDNRSRVFNTLQGITRSLKEIYQVYLYTIENKGSTLVIHDHSPQRTYGDTKSFNTTPTFIEPSHISTNYGVSTSFYSAPEQVISFHRTIFREPSTTPLGYISIDVKLDAIRELCDQLYQHDKEDLYLLDENGIIIYANNADLIGSNLQQAWISQVMGSTQTAGYFKGTGKMDMFQKLKTSDMNWTLVKRIPYQALYHDARQLTQINIYIAAFTLIIIIIATLFVSFRITKPIKQLLRYINQIQAGKLNVQIQVTSSDEIGVLAKRFGEMMDHINNLVLREYKLNLANKTNQLNALQAQINPHFMNNALQSIGTLALQQDAPQVYGLITSLANMMRYSMNVRENIVPLSKEIDQAKAYLTLQKQRFLEQFNVVMDIDEASLPILVPKMILQPLIENYFKHGFEPSLGIGELLISCKLTAPSLLKIIVMDNGRGMTEQQLEELRYQLKLEPDENLESDSIGLINVQNRLKLHFEQAVSIEVESSIPNGIILTITIQFSEVD
ncbi:MAG: hypothetical protein JWM44_2705 [Bacilli bacterium]|nr:hypothetical protein [Bacilli bacterium]